MAEESWPSPNHAAGAVTDAEYERLGAPANLSGLQGYTEAADLVYADGTGRQVKIRANRYALVRGRTWWSGPSDLTVAIAANASGSPRSDLVVLRYDRATYDVTVAVKTGAPSATPVTPSPSLSTGTAGTWELPLARVAVASGAVTLSADKVTPMAWYIADDGSLMCTSATRPAVGLVSPGTRATETDTNRVYVAGLADWLLVREDTGTVSVTLSSGWGTDEYSYVGARRINGIVYLDIDVKRTGATLAAGANVPVATAPAGYRPARTMRVSGVINQSTKGSIIGDVAPSGLVSISEYDIQIPNARWVYFGTIIYPAGG